MTDVTPIAEKVAKLVCQFDSNNANQRAMAWKALVRALSTFGADFRDLGNLIEKAGKNGNGEFKYTESDMQAGYEAGIKEGERRAAYLHSQNSRGQFRGAAQLLFPPARDMAAFCYQNIDDLSDWEREFTINMVSWTRVRPLSPKQQAHLEKIYLKLGGEVQ